MSNGLSAPTNASQAPELACTFMHLSDLHVGMSSDAWLWPAVKTAFFADLKLLLARVRALDLVIFSGDLVQRAASDEYDKLLTILEEIWAVFRDLGLNPVLFPVPGNHDLERQPATDMGGKIMRAWWSDASTAEAFWAKQPGYREFASRSFSNYEQFMTRLSASSIPTPALVRGELPGDIAAEVIVGEHHIGIIGLNSAWLQVGDGDYKGRLHVDPRQIMALTENDPDSWTKRHAVNLLVTHHPESWLHPDSLASWRADIYCGQRFDCHLFGHMHEQRTSALTEGGYSGSPLLQGASLFGLEWIEHGRTERIHGYSLGQIILTNEGRTMRQWPREDIVGVDGARKLVPNLKYNLGDDGSFDIRYRNDGATPAMPSVKPKFDVEVDQGVLDTLRRVLPRSEPAKHVRVVEQQMGLEGLSKRRMIWLVAEWGLGSDEFLDAMLQQISALKPKIFIFDLGQYRDRDGMLDGIFRDLGASFQRVCDAISKEVNAVVIFDDIEVATGGGSANIGFLEDLDGLAEAVLQYCPNAQLVLRSRRRPAQTALSVVELTALNELDVMLYIQHHPAGGAEMATEGFVRKVMGHTDGLPPRIDEALKDVELFGLDGLHLVDSDVVGKAASSQIPPPGLAGTIAQLKDELESLANRALSLLSVLTLFPRGEYFDAIRRFDHTKPFFPRDVHRLRELGLVDVTENVNLGSSAFATSGKALVVKRPVREYLTGLLPADAVQRLNRDALTLYFGELWSGGSLKPPKGMRFDERTCETWRIDNATLLILREAKDAIDVGAASRIANAAVLANAYCTALHNGQHYGSLIRAAQDFLAIYRDLDGQDQRRANIESLLGRALRMSDNHAEAIVHLKRALEADIPNTAQSGVLIALTLASESLGKMADAVSYAKHCIALDKNSNEALQAKSIILGIESVGDPARMQRMLRLAATAQRRGVTTIANNLRLTCMYEARTDDEQVKLAREVIAESSSSSSEDYNVMRASFRLCEITVSRGKALSDKDLMGVIAGYHYLLNESMDTLFNLAHKILWRHFAITGDIGNILSLFRHSSFKWHLRGKGGEDRKYAPEALALLESQLRSASFRSNREVVYLVIRSGQSLKA
ncbi:metallophosphoesterase [Xanthomonas sp. NCPPB 2632]|uniref:metallophosphoesterase n=1 Tax=Xanthomonas sp. NCPPB 2632 TaxID=3240912 RepID=UPI003516F35A